MITALSIALYFAAAVFSALTGIYVEHYFHSRLLAPMGRGWLTFGAALLCFGLAVLLHLIAT